MSRFSAGRSSGNEVTQPIEATIVIVIKGSIRTIILCYEL